MRLNNIRLRIEVIVPHSFENHGARHNLIWAPHKIFKKRKLSRKKINFAPGTLGLPLDQVDFKITDMDGRRLSDTMGTAQKRINPGEKLLSCKRLREIIIAPGIQTFYALIDSGEIAQEKYWNFRLQYPKCFDKCQSIHTRQHSIDYQQVVVAIICKLKSTIATRRVIDDMAVFGQTASDIGRQISFVLYQ